MTSSPTPRGGSADEPDIALAKVALRDQLLAARRQRGPAEIAAESAALCDQVLAIEEVRRAAVVAAYVSLGTEPGTGALLERLRAHGTRVLLPVLRPDNDLEWAAYAGPDSLQPGPRGLLQPAGTPGDVNTIQLADVVLVPGLAVDRSGLRLGRGGGSYDRVLGRVPTDALTCVLLYDNEVLPVGGVPGDRHDRWVQSVATPRIFERLRS